MTYYSKEIEMPKTRMDGLKNFVQIVINKIEAGQNNEALLSAVDLLEDLCCGMYDDAMADAKGYSAIIQEAEQKHAQAVISASHRGFEDGVAAEKARMARALDLIAA